MKSEIKAVIRSNSDRGFVPYGGCMRVCAAMRTALERSLELEDRRMAFDIHIYMLVEILKLIGHADSSSGDPTDIIRECLNGLDTLCKHASDDSRKPFFEAVVKTAKHKVFQEWKEYGYRLLLAAEPLVRDRAQAQKLYDLFPVLGATYSGQAFGESHMITVRITERLDGAEAAERYIMDHLDVKEMRRIAVERAMAAKRYDQAEQLCLDGLRQYSSYRGRVSEWAYALERIYEETFAVDKQIGMLLSIVKNGDKSRYGKLKELYRTQGLWEQKREPLLDELAKAYMYHDYASLLSREGEVERLLHIVQDAPNLIEYYGKQLAASFPAQAYSIYERQIASEAAEATDRRMYQGVCRLIKGYFDAGAAEEAKQTIRLLSETYPRRTAMQDELRALEGKLAKAARSGSGG